MSPTVALLYVAACLGTLVLFVVGRWLYGFEPGHELASRGASVRYVFDRSEPRRDRVGLACLLLARSLALALVVVSAVVVIANWTADGS